MARPTCRPAAPRRPLPPTPRQAAHRRPTARTAAVTDVFALDFDGVLVDSEREVTASATAAARARWPAAFDGEPAGDTAHHARLMRRARARLVEGYEAVVMARLVHERGEAALNDILATWPAPLQTALASYGEPDGGAALRRFFEGYRSARMTVGRAGWIRANAPYPGVVDALRECAAPWYIVSSKSAARVATLAGALFGGVPGGEALADPTSPRLLAGLHPPDTAKADALRSILKRPMFAGGDGASPPTLHFVDDRAATLAAVAAQPDLKHVRLYWAKYGYVDGNDAAVIAAAPRKIAVLPTPAALRELLVWGIVMGVDDGCEPDADEVAAGVDTGRDKT